MIFPVFFRILKGCLLLLLLLIIKECNPKDPFIWQEYLNWFLPAYQSLGCVFVFWKVRRKCSLLHQGTRTRSTGPARCFVWPWLPFVWVPCSVRESWRENLICLCLIGLFKLADAIPFIKVVLNILCFSLFPHFCRSVSGRML